MPPSPFDYVSSLHAIWPVTVKDAWGGFELYREIYDEVRDTGIPNYLLSRKPVLSGLCIQNWRDLFQGYGDKALVDLLEFGWPVDYTRVNPPKASTVNHCRDEDSDLHIRDFIAKELEMGGLIGPFVKPPFEPWFQTSPLMTKPKRNSDKKRIIVDLSFPKGDSVNAGIVKGFYQGFHLSFSLPSVSDLGRMLIDCGKGSFIWSVDLARAYWQIRTCPLSFPLLGFMHEGKYYVDVCPSFGCRTSALACARTTAALVWLLEQNGIKVLCYLDDFVGVAGTLVEAQRGYDLLLYFLNKLGLEVSLGKCVQPCQELVWLGFAANSDTLTVTIPDDKLDEVLVECERWLSKADTSRREIQSLVGKLNHIAKCIPPADRFFSRILALLRSSPFTGKVAVTDEMRMDVGWFLKFGRSFNGVCLLPQCKKKEWVIECDSTKQGGGAFSETHFYTEIYDTALTEKLTNIAQYEALNLVHALSLLLPPDPVNYVVRINTDNLASQMVLTSGKGRDNILCACARQIWLIAAMGSFELQIVHKPGVTLILADALSRFATDKRLRGKAITMCKNKSLQRVRLRHTVNILENCI